MSAAVETFAFKPGDLVLVKWNDSMVYFAKIKKIDQRRKRCVVVFDDKSQDEADFDQIHSVDETTTDIICIKCKRDDSDSPNEIVLCDKCGIGYHQKCHTPPIPASALELDTPWNCTYCLRGVKCPYLTESLDVLQNLLSDEESQSHDDVDSVTTIESDEGGEEFAAVQQQQQQQQQQYGRFLTPPKPQKKRGRKPKTKRGPKPKDTAKPHAGVVQSSREVLDGHTASLPASADEVSSLTSAKDDSSYSQLKRKRGEISATSIPKRPRKPSVQSQTISVTRIAGPVHGESITTKSEVKKEEMSHSLSKSNETGRSLFSFHNPSKSPPTKAKCLRMSESSLTETSSQPSGQAPRSLRVSLNLPDEAEPGSPLEKVIRSQKILSPKFTVASLPLWEDDIKAHTSSSTEKSVTPGGPDTSTSQQQEAPTVSRSLTPKSEGPLTPFTASALPLQAGVKTSEDEQRKRKSEEREGLPGASLPPKKTKLCVAVALSDDVLSTSKQRVAISTDTKAHTVAIETAPLTATPLEPGPSGEIKDESNIVSLDSDMAVETASTPVGYGTQTPSTMVGKTLIQETATIPGSVDKNKAGVTLSTGTPLACSAPTGHDSRQVSGLNTTTGGGMIEKQTVTSPPIIPATTEHLAGKGGGVQNPGVIKSPLAVSDQTASCTVGYSNVSVLAPPVGKDRPLSMITSQSHIQSSSVVKSPVQTFPTADVTSPSAATAVSVITVRSPVTTPSSASVGTTHSKPRHKPKMADSDIIITSVEVGSQSNVHAVNKPPNPLPSYTEAVRVKTVSPVASAKVTSTVTPTQAASVKATSAVAPTQAASVKATSAVAPTQATSAGVAYTSTIKGGHQERQCAPGMKVTAKIAEIRPGPATLPQVRPGPPQQRCPPQKTVPGATPGESQSRQVASSVVKSVGGQSSVAVMPLVASPTAYTQSLPHADSTAYTIIPTEAVVQPGVTIAMPPTRAIKPGSLPLNDTTTVLVQQTPQNATPVQYILEPLVPSASTSVVYSQTSSIPATAVTPSQAFKGGSDYTQLIANKSLPVTTTKPYAIVPAQPTASIEIQGIAIDQRGTPVISPQIPVGYSAIPAVSYIPGVVTPTSDKLITTDNWTRNIKTSRSVGGGQMSGNHQKLPDEQASSQLEEIGKNISEAFANSSEQLLISAFEDAWKKFQANGKRYQSTTAGGRKVTQSETVAHTKPIAPPNAEVVSVPGMSSRLSLIRPTYSKSKMSAVRSSPDQAVCVTADGKVSAPESQQKQQQQQRYQYVYYSDGSMVNAGTPVYAITPTDSEVMYDPVIRQAQPQGKAGQKTYHVQSAGVFVPARATDLVNSKQTTVVVDPASSQPAVKTPRNQQMSERAVSVVQQKQTADQGVQPLRKPQPSVGSGDCTTVMKQKSVPTTGKTVRQCALCTKEATYLCSGCRKIWYCGRVCQLEAWDEHSVICKS